MDKLDLYKLVFSLVGNQYWESLLMFQLVQSYISELKDDVRLIHNFVFTHDLPFEENPRIDPVHRTFGLLLFGMSLYLQSRFC